MNKVDTDKKAKRELVDLLTMVFLGVAIPPQSVSDESLLMLTSFIVSLLHDTEYEAEYQFWTDAKNHYAERTKGI